MDYSQDNFFQINKNLFQTGLTNMLKNDFKKPDNEDDLKKFDVTATEFNNNLDQINYTLKQIEVNILTPLKPKVERELKEIELKVKKPKVIKVKKLGKKALQKIADAKAIAEAEDEGSYYEDEGPDPEDEGPDPEFIDAEGGVVVKIPNYEDDQIFTKQGEILGFVEQIETKQEAKQLLAYVLLSFFNVKKVNEVFNTNAYKKELATNFNEALKIIVFKGKDDVGKEQALNDVKQILKSFVEELFDTARGLVGVEDVEDIEGIDPVEKLNFDKVSAIDTIAFNKGEILRKLEDLYNKLILEDPTKKDEYDDRFLNINDAFDRIEETYLEGLKILNVGDEFLPPVNFYDELQGGDNEIFQLLENMGEIPENVIDEPIPDLENPDAPVDPILVNIIEIADAVDEKLIQVASDVESLIINSKSSKLSKLGLTPVFNKVFDLISNLIKFIGITDVLYKGRIKKNINYLDEDEVDDIKTKISLFEENIDIVKLFIPLFDSPSEIKYKTILFQLIKISTQLLNSVNNSIGQYNPRKPNKSKGKGGLFGFNIGPSPNKDFNESPYKRFF